jgi:hypothetical protein
MYGKILREWFLFLKKRKLFSKFIIHHSAANISHETWMREKLSIKLSNGVDHIFPVKDDSLNFEYFLSNIQTMDWFLPYNDTESWYNLAVKFGELKGYIKKRESSSTWTLCYDDENLFACDRKNQLKSDKKQKKEAYGKWYDKFIGANAKNRYRR